MTEKINEILQGQKELTQKLEELASSDISALNAKLSDELAKIKTQHNELQAQITTLTEQNKKLKNVLYEQMSAERTAVLSKSRTKYEEYFNKNLSTGINELSDLELRISKRISSIEQRFRNEKIEMTQGLRQKILELEQLSQSELNDARFARNQSNHITSEERAEYDRLKNEQLTEQMIMARAKKNSFERLIGLNIINKVGIFLIILGVIFASRYTFLTFDNSLRSILIFLFGLLLLGVGEFINRKSPNVFSLGLTAAGVSVIYIGISVSYFLFGLLSMYPALIVCVIATFASFALSIRYNAQVILVFSLIGGYLPIIAISDDITVLYGLMIYFVILNLLGLSVSFKRKWTISAYLGFILNTFGSVIIVGVTPSGFSSVSLACILYLIFSYAVYICIPTIGTYTEKVKFKMADIILIGFNAFIGTVITLLAFNYFDLYDFIGAAVAIFAVIFIFVGTFIQRNFVDGLKSSGLFYLTGFTFVVLIIPFQFGAEWLTLGWLCQGTVVAIYGLVTDDKRLKKIGLVITALCLASFILIDTLFFGSNRLYTFKHLMITTGLISILIAYIKTHTTGLDYKITKVLSILCLWSFIYQACTFELAHLFIQMEIYHMTFMCATLAIILSYILAFTITKLRAIHDKIVTFLSYFIYILSVLSAFAINTTHTPFYDIYNESNSSYILIGSIIIILLFLFTAFAIYDLTLNFVRNTNSSYEWIPLSLSIFSLFFITQTLITQYHLEFSSFAISIIYVITALICIVLGFMKHYGTLRRFGLILSIVSVIKLFLIDLSSLTEGYKIISYFALGITLVAISFVYQYFSKRLELDINVKEDN